MRWFTIARAQLHHTLRRPATFVLVGLVALLSLGMASGKMTISSGDTSVGGTVVWVNAQIGVSYLVATCLVLYLFFVVLGAGSAILREEETNTMALLRATPLRPAAFVVGKLVGVLMAYGVVAIVHLVSLLFFLYLVFGVESPWVGSVPASSYIVPWLLFLLPTMAFFAALGIRLGQQRNPMLVYMTPVVIMLVSGFALWDFDPGWLPDEVDRLMMIADPFAMRWLQHTLLAADRGADFYNHATLPADATLLLNRALVVVLTALFVHRSVARARAQWRRPASKAQGSRRPAPIVLDRPLSEMARTGSPPRGLWGALMIARHELSLLVRRPGLYLLLPLLVAQLAGKVWGKEGVFGTGLVVTAGTLAIDVLEELTVLLCLVTLIFGVEALHRERAQGTDAITHGTATSTWAWVAGKVIAIWALGLGVLAIAVIGATCALALHPASHVELMPFGVVWGLFLVPTFLFWSAAVTLIYALTRSRGATHGIALALLFVTLYGAITGELTWATNWALWGGLRWSDVSIFELDRTELLLNRLAVLAATIGMVDLAARLFRRRARDPLRSSWRPPRSALRGAVGLVLAAGLVLMIHRRVEAGPQGEVASDAAEDYRKAHQETWLHAAVPSLKHVELTIEVDPASRSFSTSGRYRIINHHGQALDRFAVTVGQHWSDTQFALDGTPLAAPRAGLLVVEPAVPLAPGATAELTFTHRGRHPDGARKRGGEQKQFIVPSAVMFTSFEPHVVPVLGFMRDLGVDEDNETEPRTYFPGYHEGRLDPLIGSATAFTTDITLIGPADFTFNSVGHLVSDETRGDRRHTQWKSDVPVRFYNVVGGRYEVERGDGVAVFYDPHHAQNIDVMLDTLAAARDHYGAWFGAYPYDELKLTEFPTLATYAQGFPSNITFAEGIGFLADGQLNSAFTITAHEAAHQWWANMLTPGEGPGAGLLSESLAHFSALLLLEEERGSEARAAFARILEKRYLEERRVDGERPLRWVDGSRTGDTTLIYEKGGLSFWTLMQQGGRSELLAGLKAFIKAYGDGPDFPAVPDMLEVLRGHAADPVAFDAMAEQLFGRVVLPAYVLEDVARVDELGAKATLRNQGSGRFRVEVAAMRGGAPCARTEVELGAGLAQEVSLTCPDDPPARLVVDPDVHVMMVARDAASADLP